MKVFSSVGGASGKLESGVIASDDLVELIRAQIKRYRQAIQQLAYQLGTILNTSKPLLCVVF